MNLNDLHEAISRFAHENHGEPPAEIVCSIKTALDLAKYNTVAAETIEGQMDGYIGAFYGIPITINENAEDDRVLLVGKPVDRTTLHFGFDRDVTFSCEGSFNAELFEKLTGLSFQTREAQTAEREEVSEEDFMRVLTA